MTGTHSGRVAVVTGAARGIGRAIAIALGRREAKLVLIDREAPTGVAQQIGGEVLALAADVASQQDWEGVGQAVEDRFGRADIVVNNAGIGAPVAIDDLDFALWRRTFKVNLDAHFFSAKTFLPRMRKNRWGRIVCVSSNSIGIATPGLSHYMATKMGVIGFVRGLANDVAADGVTVNAVLPALTNTPLIGDMPDEAKRAVWEMQAIKRLAEPEDIAEPVCFLTSNESAFITGQSLVVDGGLYKIS
jgi:3-oxoacyl-[acyl-carrier protein] reductase